MEEAKTMRRISLGAVAVIILSSSLSLSAADRWIHVRVNNQSKDGETVSVNVPLALAEQVLPAINAGNLRDGKVKIQGKLNGVDVQRLLEAVRTSGNNQFVSVKSKDEDVHVAKERDSLVVQVHQSKARGSDVNVRIPIEVANALFSSGNNELDVLAAVRALEKIPGNADLVTVHDGTNNVHIWVDSNNDAD
jgi:hypothetical protein